MRGLAPVVAIASAAVLALLPAPAGAAATTAPPPVAPLASTFTSAAGSWAVLAMGRPANPNDVFWELFYRAAGSSGWSLVTPRAAADNGGLTIDDSGSVDQVAGIEPSRYLKFSPLAATGDAGAKWTPGILPAALSKVPDNLAAMTSTPAAAGRPGRVLALSAAGGGSLLESAGGLTDWRSLATVRSLDRTSAGRACGRVTLRAVASSDGSPELGAACSRHGVVGIFVDRSGSWKLVGPHLSGKAADDDASVLRLTEVGTSIAGLVEVGRGRRQSLYALWQSAPVAPWRLSDPLPLRGHLVATGFSSAGQAASVTVVVSSATGRSELAYRAEASSSGWGALPELPAGTAAVVGPEGAGSPLATADALVTGGKQMTDWQLGADGGTWSRAETVTVPLQYGSST